MMWPFAAAICTVVVPSFKKLTNFSSHSLLRQPETEGPETETAPLELQHMQARGRCCRMSKGQSGPVLESVRGSTERELADGEQGV